MSKSYNENIKRLLQLSREMLALADEGDLARDDESCGVLYGILRDCAYRLRALAEKEKQLHIDRGKWD
jgi:hypothetical protein